MITTLFFVLLALPLMVLYGISWWFRLKFSHIIQLAESLPNPLPRLPIIGHGYVFFSFFNPVDSFYKMASDALAKGYNTVSLWLGPVPIIVILGREDIQKILTSSHSKERPKECSDSVRLVFKEGVACSTGDQWKLKRKRMNHLFNSKNVESYLPVFSEQSKALVNKLANHVEGPAVDVFNYVMNMSYHAISKFVFGKHFNPAQNPNFDTETSKALEIGQNIAHKILLLPWLRIDFILDLFYKKQKKIMNTNLDKLVNNYLEQMSEKKPSLFASNNNEFNKKLEEEDDFKDSFCLADVFEMYKEEYAQYGQKDFKDVFTEMYLAGSESVTTAICTCLSLLAQHSDVQERLSEEILSVMGSEDLIAMDHLRRMPYLDQVYKESLRFTNTFASVPRQVTQQISLSTCTLPVNTPVHTFIGAISFDPKVYPNPKVFQPERFSKTEGSKRPKMEFFPFSDGPHKCIGYYYSELVYKVTIVQVIRNFRLTTDVDATNMKKTWRFIVKSAEGHKMKIHKRN